MLPVTGKETTVMRDVAKKLDKIEVPGNKALDVFLQPTSLTEPEKNNDIKPLFNTSSNS